MTLDQIVTGILSVGALVIGYFVQNLVKDLKQLQINMMAAEAKSFVMEGEMALLKQETKLKHDRLEEKMVDLAKSMDALTTEIKILNNKHRE